MAEENDENKFDLLKKESEKYDYAILKLKVEVKRTKYPKLYPDFEEPHQLVKLSGYTSSHPQNDEPGYYPSEHSGLLEITNTGGQYDIDTKSGHSGSPVFFVDQCLIVATHKGGRKDKKRNFCTRITR